LTSHQETDITTVIQRRRQHPRHTGRDRSERVVAIVGMRREKCFHITDVRHACDKAGDGGDHWVKKMMKAGLVVKRGRDQYEIAKLGSLDPE